VLKPGTTGARDSREVLACGREAVRGSRRSYAFRGRKLCSIECRCQCGHIGIDRAPRRERAMRESAGSNIEKTPTMSRLPFLAARAACGAV